MLDAEGIEFSSYRVSTSKADDDGSVSFGTNDGGSAPNPIATGEIKMVRNVENNDRVVGLLGADLLDDSGAHGTEFGRKHQPERTSTEVLSRNRRQTGRTFRPFGIKEFALGAFDGDDPDSAAKTNKKHIHLATDAESCGGCGGSEHGDDQAEGPAHDRRAQNKSDGRCTEEHDANSGREPRGPRIFEFVRR